MRRLFRLLGLIVLGCFAILLVNVTVFSLKKMWGKKSSDKGHVAVVDVEGIIYDVRHKVREIKEIVEDKQAKALVVRINSPGGLVGPSQELYQALKETDKTIPVIASMGALAASGGYYTALGARKIYANSGTLTASIGVIMEFANTQKLFQWAKVDRYALKAGKFKDIGSANRPMTNEERELLLTMMDDIHTEFKDTVRLNRSSISKENFEHSTDGRVMTGKQAFKAGLVDTLGGFELALQEAKKIAQLPLDAPVDFPEAKTGLLKKLFLGDPDERTESIFPQFTSLIKQLAYAGKFRLWLLAPLY